MKRLFLLLSLIIFLSSCSVTHYMQLVTLHSDNVTDNGGDYTYQDYNIKVDYRFNNKDGVFEFSVYNTSNEDIFIDLEKSVFVYNSKVYDYAGREDSVSAYTESSLTYGSTSVLSTQSSGVAVTSSTKLPSVVIEPLPALILTKIFIASCFSLVIQNLMSMFAFAMKR